MNEDSAKSLERIRKYLKGDLNEAEGAWFLDKNALRLQMAERDALSAELAEFRALGGGDARFALANVRASVENWENAPNMDVYRQAVFENPRLRACNAKLVAALERRGCEADVSSLRPVCSPPCPTCAALSRARGDGR